MEELKRMQSYLEEPAVNEPLALQERINNLMVLLARSAELLATAKKNLRRKKSSEIGTTIVEVATKAGLSKNVQNALLESIAEEEAFLVDWLDRINSTIVHQIDGLRSMLSYAKEELRLTNNY